MAAPEKLVVGKLLGSGQFGDVHLAETSSGEKRAVKRIKAASMKSSKHVQNLEREIKLLRDSAHPNIVRLFGVKRRGDEFWLIFEYCGGGDLSQYIRSRQPKPRLSESIAHGFFRQLASGLLFMSENNLVHRDLKPANLLLSSASDDAVLKICDFGFARSLSGDTLAQTQCGSPLYMAPEILTGHPHDGKVDTYSAGAILFEMLAGRPPFGGVDVPDLIHNQTKQLKIPVQVSRPCLQVISMLLQRQPHRRADARKLSEAEWFRGETKGGENNADGDDPGFQDHTRLAPAELAEDSALSGSVAVSGWELVPSESTAIGEALLLQADMRRTALLKIDELVEEQGDNQDVVAQSDAFLQGINEVMECSRKAAEHLGAANSTDPRVSQVLGQLHDFLRHPAVDRALARSEITAVASCTEGGVVKGHGTKEQEEGPGAAAAEGGGGGGAQCKTGNPTRVSLQSYPQEIKK
mmetsp:Transcript_14753/g.30300  ORF Transcript_14753/g.30300 Transcript_14753/m.30300 type:complete len:466 (+) Transcript_14753:188-1585(+)